MIETIKVALPFILIIALVGVCWLISYRQEKKRRNGSFLD